MIGTATKSPRPITGRMVLFCLIAFFAIVALANGLLVRFALTTFGGLETASSYQAGFAFEREAAAARAQDERHWQVQGRVLPPQAEHAPRELIQPTLLVVPLPVDPADLVVLTVGVVVSVLRAPEFVAREQHWQPLRK